jgi:hypothetical protein
MKNKKSFKHQLIKLHNNNVNHKPRQKPLIIKVIYRLVIVIDNLNFKLDKNRLGCYYKINTNKSFKYHSLKYKLYLILRNYLNE